MTDASKIKTICPLQGLGIPLEHFHAVNADEAEVGDAGARGGHLNNDSSPETAHYEAYMNVAPRLLHIE